MLLICKGQASQWRFAQPPLLSMLVLESVTVCKLASMDCDAMAALLWFHNALHAAQMTCVAYSPVVTEHVPWRLERPLTAAQTRERITGRKIEPAVDRVASSALLSCMLHRPVTITRKAMPLRRGARALVPWLRQSLPEEAVLDRRAIERTVIEPGWQELPDRSCAHDQARQSGTTNDREPTLP